MIRLQREEKLPAAPRSPVTRTDMKNKNRLWRWLAGTLLALTLVAGGLFAAFHFAVQALKGKVEAALGAQGEVAEIRVGTAAVEILGLRLRAGGKSAWPAADELRAARIVVEPDLRSLFSDQVRVRKISIEGAYLSTLRSRDGRLRVLPALLESAASGAPAATPPIFIAAIELKDSALDFFDATVRQPPLRLRLEQVNATLADVQLPDLAGQTPFALEARLKGPQRDGRVSIRGRAEIASKDSDVSIQLRGVDLVALQPYLIKAAETGVRKGSLDLDVRTTVRKKHLHAPGTLTLTGLELASAGNTFMGMPRAVVVSLLKDKHERIDVKFTLEGNLDDPRFSLNDSFATRIGASVAETLGVSIEGLAKGVGSAGRGIGEALGKLFGGK